MKISSNYIGIAVGGGLGALARLGVFSIIDETLLKVLVCNIAGTFIYALANDLSEHLPKEFRNFIMSGFCGGISIFATFSKDSVLALQERDFGEFFANLFSNFTLCVIAVFAAGWIVKRSKKLLSGRGAK